MTAYYNENDPTAAQWLRNLIAKGVIAPGEVDERDIRDVAPRDLMGFSQCHFFAGIGVWSYALRLAGVEDDEQWWTGSCPCQPFSASGKRKGFDDERHLWPYWHHLIRVCRPVRVAGEQVAAKDGLAWLDLVQADLEGESYACAPLDFCAAGVGAPHRRQRLYFVADTDDAGLEGRRQSGRECAGELAARTNGLAGRMGIGDRECGPTNGFWRDADWLFCRGQKWRPVEPGTFPLADGTHSRVGRICAYGNAINPYNGSEVISSYREARGLVSYRESEVSNPRMVISHGFEELKRELLELGAEGL